MASQNDIINALDALYVPHAKIAVSEQRAVWRPVDR
jgi:hypothetical protein